MKKARLPLRRLLAATVLGFTLPHGAAAEPVSPYRDPALPVDEMSGINQLKSKALEAIIWGHSGEGRALVDVMLGR